MKNSKKVIYLVQRITIRDIKVLVHLSKEPKQLVELSRELNIPPSTLHGILTKLQAMGYVDKKNGAYHATTQGNELIKQVASMLAG